MSTAEALDSRSAEEDMEIPDNIPGFPTELLCHVPFLLKLYTEAQGRVGYKSLRKSPIKEHDVTLSNRAGNALMTYLKSVYDMP
eukprot:10091867-Karenia_brevis.AAC.1